MATVEDSINLEKKSPEGKKSPAGGLRFDWIVIILSAWLLGGIYLDGWAHHHIPQLETFFTPWHAVLYSGFLAVAIFLVFILIRNRAKGYPWLQAMPPGYELSLFGVAVFAVGGVLDMIWHILFGIEVSTEALLSPTHLMLALGILLIISGPLRAAWLRLPKNTTHSWRKLFPMVLSIAFILSILTFMTQYAHPFVNAWASKAEYVSSSASDLPSDVYVMNADGSSQTRLTNDRFSQWTPSWSPDGIKIAFNSNQSGTYQIYVMNADGSGLTQLTHDKSDHWDPAWSPDGTRIAFGATPGGGNFALYVMNADGGGLKQLTSNSDNDWGPAWSPDGTKVAFNARRNGSLQVYVMNADGSDQRQLTTGGKDNWGPAWSPDGTKIAFTSERNGNLQLYLMNPDGSNQARLISDSFNDWWPAYSPDGRKIAFVSDQGGNADIYLMNTDGSHQVNLSNNPGAESGGRFAWSPDGKKIVYISRGHAVHSGIDTFFTQSLGVVSILLQAAILMGLLLLIIRRWTLPPGSFTLIFTLSTVLISFMNDQYLLIPAAVLTGIIADVLFWRLRPSTTRIGMLRLFAFAVPLVFYGLYFLDLLLTNGIGWSIHLWMGSAVLAGVVGLLLSYLLVPPLASTEQEQANAEVIGDHEATKPAL
jgi:Tol biopolymer transport system component